MNINLSKQLIKRISKALWQEGATDIWVDFNDAVSDSKPKEIKYKNYGLDELVDDIKEYRKKINGTNLNYKDLERDESGRFLPKYRRIARFDYNSPNTGLKYRTIELTHKDADYLVGLDMTDNNKEKRFRRDRIVGKIINIKQPIE